MYLTDRLNWIIPGKLKGDDKKALVKIIEDTISWLENNAEGRFFPFH